MPVSAKLDPISRDISVMISETLSPQARSAILAQAAREAIDEAAEINRRSIGRVPERDIYVDGALGKPVETVRPDGVVVAEFDLTGDMVAWIDRELRRASPRLTGRYQRSHTWFADGIEFDPSAGAPEGADEIVALSLVPYARKIERGASRQAPEGVYEITARKAAGRYGNIARIKFSFRSARGSSMLGSWAKSTRISHRGHASAVTRDDWLTRQPAIVIMVR